MTNQVNRWTMQHEDAPRYLSIDAGATVLVLEDSEERLQRFRSWMPDCVLARTVEEAIDKFDIRHFDWLFIDRDLGGLEAGYGEDFVKHIVERVPQAQARGLNSRVVIHSANIVASRYMETLLKDAGVQTEVIPFTILGVFQETHL